MKNGTAFNSEVIDNRRPDLRSIFPIDSYFFRRVVVGERAVEILEWFLAIFLLILLAPVMIVVVVAIKIFSPGEVFYTQTRVGKNGKLFPIYKFRTMVADAEAKTGAIISSTNDPRVTALGKILRASHIDEFPQLLNVIRGEMSFVGPRPERPEFVQTFEKDIPGYIRRREVRPGITGVAQICLPYDANAAEKIIYDTFFIDNRRSVQLSVMVCYYTAMKMLMALRDVSVLAAPRTTEVPGPKAATMSLR